MSAQKWQRPTQETKAAPAVSSAPAVSGPINTTNVSLILVLASRLLTKPSVVLEADRAPIEARVRALAAETFGGSAGDWAVERAFERAVELSR